MKKVKQLLLVEDDPVSAFLAQTTIEETDIAEQIVLCENGRQALDHLYKGVHPNNNHEISFPELIFLDLNMPVMNGYEFLKEYMEIEELNEKNIHVVILSSASLEKEKKRIESLPVSAYIEKPINELKLKEVVSFLAVQDQ